MKARRQAKGVKDMRILTEFAHFSAVDFDRLTCAFLTLMSFAICAEKCQELIHVLTGMVNCSLCIFLFSHGSSDLDSFSLYFTSLYSPSLLPHCM